MRAPSTIPVMKVMPTSLWMVFLGVLVACQPGSEVKKTDQGISLSIEAEGVPKHTLTIEVVSEAIFHITATPENSSEDSVGSLMVEAKSYPPVSWELVEGDGTMGVKTARARAVVKLATGEVTFMDASGKIILAEKSGGGKEFTPVSVEGNAYYAIRQQFESPDDEAFYGLGQHQNGEMNYKGRDVELAQHNIVAVVPFVYSSRNYGILWDNYSITRFGDPRAYGPLSGLQLFDTNGEAGGLTATYYAGDKIKYTKKENSIAFEYLETPQLDTFPKDVAQNGKIVWEGSVASDNEGTHKFLLYGSGYFKLWIDDQLIMDKWRQNWNPWSNKFSLAMKPGEKHKFKLEWITQGGYMAVKHLDPLAPEEQKRLSLFSEVARKIDYYFIAGENADDVIGGYRYVTGAATLLPKWAFGFWQSRERYRTQQELLDVVKQYRKDQVPIDNIVLDWNYWPEDQWGSHQFDPERFPDAAGMVKELHDTWNTNILISVWPKFYPGVDNFDALNSKGYLFQRNLEKKRIDWIAQGYHNTFYDPFSAGARELFWKQINERLNSKGFDGWWLDATEPDMHSNLSIEERKLNMSPTAVGPGTVYFNGYSLMNSKGVFEGQRTTNPDRRVFILTRSAFAGQQRYGSVTWSGDIVSRWSDFRDQISAGVNFSLSGIPFWTMDIGGFAVENRYYNPTPKDLDEWRELNTRWFQFGAFCPLFRVHGQYPFREMYNIAPKGHVVYNTLVYYDKLRYRLMPYIYSIAGRSSVDDYTMMRGLVMDFPTDTKVQAIDDQYMFGPALLISPVHEYKARERELYLPAGQGWYDFYSGAYYEGGNRIKVAAPLERMPVFVRAGSILTAGPEIQYTSEKEADPITVYVYAGADGAFDLYEDDGLSNGYEEDEFSTIPFTYSEATQTLTIGKREGTFNGMLDERTFHMVWVKRDSPVGVALHATPQQVVQYNGTPVEVKLQ